MRSRIATYGVDLEIVGDHQVKVIHLDDQQIGFDEDSAVATIWLSTYTAERLLLDLLAEVGWLRENKR